jgi:hypothetical protein
MLETGMNGLLDDGLLAGTAPRPNIFSGHHWSAEYFFKSAEISKEFLKFVRFQAVDSY